MESNMNKNLSTLIGSSVLAVVGVLGVIGNQSASAATIVSQSFEKNDCSGYFGQGFDACQIFINQNHQRIELSPVIAKFDTPDKEDGSGSWEINPKYDVDGNEWTFSKNQIELPFLNNLKNDDKTGTWTYNPGSDDPGIKYWAVKGGKGFDLFWQVDNSAVEDRGVCSGSDKYTLDCLKAAQVVTTGTWSTPENNGGNQAGLSHITFYNAKPPRVVDPDPGQPVEVPEPGTVAGLVLMGFGIVASRRRHS